MSGPGNDERRPGRGGGSVEQAEFQGHHTASYRLSTAGLAVEVGARTAWVYGRNGRDVFELLDEVGIGRRMWDRKRRGWMVPVQFADDVIAWAEWRQRRVVTVKAVTR